MKINFIKIPAGSFLMGSANDGWSEEKPQHLVTLKAFAMSETPITQAQWKKVATELPKVNLDLNPNPSKFKGTDLPVENVSWEEAIEFCSRMTKYTQHKITLPTEAQWEYACRAGTTTEYSCGDTINKTLANYCDCNVNRTTPVHNYSPNPWGLYDMHGNVFEWCLDDWHDDYNGAPIDGSAWYGDDEFKVVRGGSWYSVPDYCRSACRSASRNYCDFDYILYYCDFDYTPFGIGFRVVINP